jgi:hypothetical protein
MVRKMGGRIGLDDLRAILAKMRSDLPTVSEPCIRDGLAKAVFFELLPGVRRNKGEVSRLYNVFKNTPFYQETTHDRVYALPHQEQLANSLLSLQNVPGFDAYMAEFLKRKRWDQLHWQLFAGYCLSRAGILAELVVPSRRAGNDFDFRLEIDGVSVPCEVESKLARTEPRWGSIESSLRKGKGQLPPGTPSLVWLTIPRGWEGNRQALEPDLESYIREWTERDDVSVVGVVVQSETVANEMLVGTLSYYPTTEVAEHLTLFREITRRLENPSVYGPHIADVF